MNVKKLMAVASMVAAGSAFAATNVLYTASDTPANSPDANGGTVNVWSTSVTNPGDPGQNGFFQADSTGNGGAAGAGTSAWATYANSNQETFSSHVFAGGALDVGQTLSLQFDNGGIDPTKSTGIQLFNGGTLLFQLYFRGGQSVYEYIDDTGVDLDTSEGFTRDGGTFSFTLNTATTYSATWRGANWSSSIQNLGIDRIQVYNNSAGSGSGSNVYFNNLQVVPEPSSALFACLGTLAMLRRRR